MRFIKVNFMVELSAALFLALFTSAGCAAEYSRATIFYYDWDVLVRVALTPNDVRSRYFVKTEVADATYVNNLAKVFSDDSQPVPKVPESLDVRLVIDLYTRDGRVVTYYATRSHLYFDGGSNRLLIDDSFRDKFRFLETIAVED